MNIQHVSRRNISVGFEECDVGHLGPNCSYKCPFPYYGWMCNAVCDCSSDVCHFAAGCAELNEATGITLKDIPRIIKIEKE